MLLASRMAGAAQARHLHGVVLALTPRTGTVVVRHDAFAGMPAMTMTFGVIPQARARELQPGAVIDADVDVATDPWTLRHVRSEASRCTLGTRSPIRHSSINTAGRSASRTFAVRMSFSHSSTRAAGIRACAR
jgi:Cu/Ag efflux protein CusF